MAWTFAANLTDKITVPVTSGAPLGNSTQGMFLGWFYPTTLTATRTYWFAGTVAQTVRVDTTTSELRLIGDRVTSDSIWTTSTAGIVINVWQYIACYFNVDSGGAINWTVWKGTAETPPKEVTAAVSAAGSGAGVQSTVVMIGGNGSTLPFQGDIGSGWILFNDTLGFGFFPTVTPGALSASDKEWLLNNVVIPTWRGERPNIRDTADSTRSMSIFYDFDTPIVALGQHAQKSSGTVQTNPAVLTITGATYSTTNQAPNRMRNAGLALAGQTVRR